MTTKKKTLLLALALLTGNFLSAQEQPLVDNDQKTSYRSGFELGAGGALRYDGRAGVSGHFKYIFPTNDPRQNRFMITAKAIHLPSTDKKGFFNVFDGNASNNISAAYLMAGYRINLIRNSRYGDRLFLDLNAGGGMITRKTPAFVFNPVIQYGISANTDKWYIYGGANLSVSKWEDPNVIEVGIIYKFR